MNDGGTNFGTGGSGGVRIGTTSTRRRSISPTIRLAAGFSVVATFVALVLDTVGEVSRPGMAVTVAAVGFAMSWVQSGRQGLTDDRSFHRLAVVPLRQPAG